ncbi:MAG: ATP-dependent protease ATPase subunit HslU, partial [Zetaproteobacteria bacterium]
PRPLRDEIIPKNILMIGPTGVGKTEIARRLAKLAKAPFVKVEATKYTEVGYVGRDVETIVRDLVDAAVKMVREEAVARVRVRAEALAEERLLDALLPGGGSGEARERFRRLLRAGELEEREVEVEVESAPEPMPMPASPQMELPDLRAMLEGLFGRRTTRRRMKVREAREVLTQQEANRLLDWDAIRREAVQRAEEEGIVFIDEMDKIAAREGRAGADVSREGVQRDLLPIIEGTTVHTRYGPVRTDYVLFIGSGAFQIAKPSDLIPELQGRFPIRVHLDPLTSRDFERILRDTENSLIRQYQALLAAEGVKLVFTDDGIAEIARFAEKVNARTENIGARRLYTIMEHVLEDISFAASDLADQTVTIDAAYVRERLSDIETDEDLTRYIL